MIDQRGAVIRRVLSMSGLPATILLPARAFRGVAARALEDSDGNVTVTLELLHNDPQLSVPLLVADDLDDVAADWRAWAEEYRLPMLLIEADGVARTLEESLGAVKSGAGEAAPQAQRCRQPRRSRFLARRKSGDLGLRLVIGGEEIIARVRPDRSLRRSGFSATHRPPANRPRKISQPTVPFDLNSLRHGPGSSMSSVAIWPAIWRAAASSPASAGTGASAEAKAPANSTSAPP